MRENAEKRKQQKEINNEYEKKKLEGKSLQKALSILKNNNNKKKAVWWSGFINVSFGKIACYNFLEKFVGTGAHNFSRRIQIKMCIYIQGAGEKMSFCSPVKMPDVEEISGLA